jgi:TolB-like protein/Tfp pilus assembly protein PilF
MVVVEEEPETGRGLSGAIDGRAARLLPMPQSLARRRWMAGALFLVLVGLVAGGFFLWRYRRSEANLNAPVQSLAVLPFQPLSSGSDNDHLGLGVADAIITKLSNIRQLPVRPTDVAVRYADGKVDPMQAARELGVDSVLTGKIQQADNRIRVTVQLIRVRDGQALWAQTFDENYTNIFAVEDAISERVVEAMAVNLAGDQKLRLQRHYTENIDAYRNYLEGRYEEFTFTRTGMNKAIEYFSHAISDDPSYALAYAGLADAYTTESDWLLSPREALPKAEAAARKAITFDPNLAEAHAALAHALLHEWRLAESNQEFHTALALNPGDVSAYFAYGEYLGSVGHENEAIAELNKALKMDPLSPEINSFLAWEYYVKRDYASCLTTASKAMQMFPDFWVPHLTAGMCYYITGRFPEAIQEYRRALAMNPEGTFSNAGLAMSMARSGDRAGAEKILEDLKTAAKTSYVSPCYIGLIYMTLGDTDAEFVWFAKGFDDRSEWLLWLPEDPMFDGQRGDPRFRELVKRVGVVQ